MKNTTRKRESKEVEPVVQLALADVVRADLRKFVIAAGTAALSVVLEHERTRIVGPRYAHLPGREAHRAGSAPGELVLGGRRVQVRRPRVRTHDSREVALPSWHAPAFARRWPVSCRHCDRCGIRRSCAHVLLPGFARGESTRGNLSNRIFSNSSGIVIQDSGAAGSYCG